MLLCIVMIDMKLVSTVHDLACVLISVAGVFNDEVGCTGTDLCPVDALLDYLGRRGNLAGPLFCLETGPPLQRRSFTAQVQQALSASGVDGSLFNGHSFRLGAATSASIAGVSESIIKRLGRWQSSAYQQYIRTPPSDLAHISQQLVASDSSTNL